ncbi:MAG: NUDIX hydrolase [Oscillospiraceae bacterium]|nr:NUDIX hydrolase [Oscillospiraceae bacterium]
MDYSEKLLAQEEIFEGKVIHVHRDTVLLPDGSQSFREIVDHHGGVGVLPVDDKGNVCCVRQFRYAFGEHVLEMPAGKLEAGEDPLECAVRELGEETGFTAEHITELGHFYPTPGYCREILHLYLATGLKPGQAHLDQGEFLDVEWHSLDELEGMAMRGELRDAKTMISVLMAKRILAGERRA